MQVITNDSTRLIESILRQGEREDLGQWRVIDLETDALRRLGAERELSEKQKHKYRQDSYEFRQKQHRKRLDYKARAARIVHGDGTYKLCHFRDDQFGKRLVQMRRRGQVVVDKDGNTINFNASACGRQTRSDTVSGTTLRGMIYLYADADIPLCAECCKIIVGGFDVDETED